MKIEIDLPDWVDERHIRIFAGVELAAFKWSHEDFWKVKDGRCQQCGECCTNLKNHTEPTINGECIHLDEERKGKRLCKRQEAFEKLEALWKARELVKIVTIHKVYKNI